MTLSEAFRQMIKKYHEGIEPEEYNKVKKMKYTKKYFDKIEEENGFGK